MKNLIQIAQEFEQFCRGRDWRFCFIGGLALQDWGRPRLIIGCPVDQSPEEIALSYLNNCAYACGMKPVFRSSYYVGTIGEYDRGAV